MGSWLCYSDIIPIYLEYVGCAGHFQAPSEVIAKCLILQASTFISDCIEQLKKRNLYVLIIADEIEQVYTGEDSGSAILQNWAAIPLDGRSRISAAARLWCLC